MNLFKQGRQGQVSRSFQEDLFLLSGFLSFVCMVVGTFVTLVRSKNYALFKYVHFALVLVPPLLFYHVWVVLPQIGERFSTMFDMSAFDKPNTYTLSSPLPLSPLSFLSPSLFPPLTPISPKDLAPLYS